MKNPHHNEEWLIDAFERHETIVEVAEEAGVSDTNIINWMDKFGINNSPDYHDKETLREDIKELKTQTAVAEKYGVSQATIGHFVRKYNIEQKDWSYDSWEEDETPYRNENLLREACENNSSVSAVAEELDCTRRSVSKWMDKHDINIEFWGDGDKYSSPYPGGWRKISQKIRERDGECLRCGATPERTLSVHHIIPVVEFDDPTDAHYPDNLATVCRSCHRKVENLPEQEQREILQ